MGRFCPRGITWLNWSFHGEFILCFLETPKKLVWWCCILSGSALFAIINAIFRDWSTFLLWPLKTYNGQSHLYCSLTPVWENPSEYKRLPRIKGKKILYKQDNHICKICLFYTQRKNGTHPLHHVFQPIKIIWKNLVEGHPRTNCTKSFWNLTCSF